MVKRGDRVRCIFKYQLKSNTDVEISGIVYIPENENADDSEFEIEFERAGQTNTSQLFINHHEVGVTPTYEQNIEIDRLEELFTSDIHFLTNISDFADENKTIVGDEFILIINDGAKMECEIREPDAFLNMGYVVELIPQFNGERIDIASYMTETFEEFDPWNVSDDSSYIENRSIFFEMSKDYWDDDCKEERLADVNEEARRIYARSLTRELGIYAKYGEIMEQSMDDHYEDDWLFKMSQLVNKSDEELDAFLREEGYINSITDG